MTPQVVSTTRAPGDRSIRAEEQRLRRIFRRILLVTAFGPVVPAGLEACSSSSNGAGSDAGTPDATVLDGDGAGGDGSPDAQADAIDDELTGACAPTPYAYTPPPPPPPDAGADADAAADPDADAGDRCAAYVRLPCGLPASIIPRANCIIGLSDCYRMCDGLFFYCHAADDSCVDGSIPSGPITIDCVTCVGAVGRRPEGLAAASFAPAADDLGGFFARAAHLEEASVRAFHTLEQELVELGAPASLVRSAARAARDEVRHTAATRRLARRFGGVPATPRVERARRRRSLEQIAIENAVEGCVRETYGALVAAWQAEHAADRDVASTMRTIAEDEARHAALAWAVARWAEPRLSAAAQRRLRARRRDAVAALEREAAAVPPTLARDAGFPQIGAQRRLVGALKEILWTA